MKSQYLYTKTTVSLIRYHFVFCPRYKRKIFLIEGVEERFEYLTRKVCEKNGFEILYMECGEDYVHLFLSSPPQWSPSDIVNAIKSASSRPLRDEFSLLTAMPSLWTRNFFVTTADNVSNRAIQKYVKAQKNRL